MNYTDIYNLPCPSPEDYAGVPLYLETLAYAIEDTLVEQQGLLEGFLDRGSGIWTRNTNQLLLTDVRTEVTFPIVFGGAGFTLMPTPYLPATRGWYYVGAWCNMLSTGATTVNTLRQLDLAVWTTVSPADRILLDSWRCQVTTTNTAGGDDLWVGGTVFSDGVHPYPIEFIALSGNVVNVNVTVTAPPFVYFYFLGDTPDIRQVP